MRIIILSANQIYANKVVKDLINEFGKEIVLIVEPAGLLPRESFVISLRKILRICGFEYFFYQSLKIILFKGIGYFYTIIFSDNIHSKFFLMRKLANLKMIDIIKVKDINDDMVLELVDKKRPDLIVSVFFNQLLNKKVLKIPRLGAINIHPGLLPGYRGTSPIFWSLVNGEKFSGVSIHKMDEGIDTGEIYKKVKIDIENQDTEDSLYWKSVCMGSGELIKVIKKINRGSVRTLLNRGGKFFSFPTKASVKQFKKNKRSFLKLRQFISMN